MIKRYEKKPVVVEAVKWDGFNTYEVEKLIRRPAAGLNGVLYIVMSGRETVHASRGDYIVKGVNGDFFVCKPDVFAQTYGEVEG